MVANSNSRISVIITSYNQKEYLLEAIESVIQQTNKPFEILICDDASEDGSRDLIKEYEKKFPGLIKGVLHEINLGISENRNSGLKAAGGDYVTWLDGDDRIMPDKLAIEYDKITRKPEIKWVYSQVKTLMVQTGASLHRYSEFYDGYVFEKVLFMLGRAPRNPLVEFNALKRVGFFDPNLELYEDFDLLIRLAKYFPCSYSEEPLMEYRVHSGGLHATSAGKHIKNVKTLWKNIEPLLSNCPKDTVHKARQHFSQIKKRLLMKQNLFEMQQAIEKGQRLTALKYWKKANSFNKRNLTRRNTYTSLMKILFS